MEPRYNELGTRNWQNLFAIARFRYLSRFFFIYFNIYWDKENRSLYRGLRYIEVRYSEIPLYWDKENRSLNRELRYIEVRYIEVRYIEVRYIEVPLY